MPPKEGMMRTPVDIETATIEVNLDLADDEVAVGGITAAGTRLLAKVRDDGTGKGRFEVVSAPGATIGPTPADVVVGVGATAILTAPPAGTSRMTVQNTGPAGTLIRVRESGGLAGAGIILARFASISFGGDGGAVAPVEVEEVAGIATSATIMFEGP